MDNELLREAAVECADEYLSGETAPLFTVPDTIDEHTAKYVESFIEVEANRFSSYLRAYIYDRIEAGDYVK
jgi:hypothetical protein